MNDFAREELEEYIQYRRNAINDLLKQGIIPGFIDTIEINKMHGVLEELKAIEGWFDE